jgi:hypothetical protein
MINFRVCFYMKKLCDNCIYFILKKDKPFCKRFNDFLKLEDCCYFWKSRHKAKDLF